MSQSQLESVLQRLSDVPLQEQTLDDLHAILAASDDEVVFILHSLEGIEEVGPTLPLAIELAGCVGSGTRFVRSAAQHDVGLSSRRDDVSQYRARISDAINRWIPQLCFRDAATYLVWNVQGSDIVECARSRDVSIRWMMDDIFSLFSQRLYEYLEV